MNPKEIAKMISEDIDTPISELTQAPQVPQQDTDGKDLGDMRIVHDMARDIAMKSQELYRYTKKGNIRGARTVIDEIGGAVKKAAENINRLADEKGLIEPERQNHR